MLTSVSTLPAASHEAANKVTQALQSILQICQARASLISWLSLALKDDELSQSVSDHMAGLDEVVRLLDDIDGITGINDDVDDNSQKRNVFSGASLWKKRLQEECQLWRFVVKAKLSLESCR